MLFEVYTGAKPGRPRLLLFITAALLAGALGLAWLQVRAGRTLGPEERVGDTPLWVRLPKGWRADPENPQRYILPTGGGAREVFERSLRFDFVRLSDFEPVAQLVSLPDLVGAGQVVDITPARLGPYAAAQVRTIQPIQIGRTRLARAAVMRVTCLPRGHMLRVVYEPLSELGPTDLDIVEEVCATLRVADPSLSGAPQDYLKHAGLTLPLDAGWQVVGADFPEVPGLYIGGLAKEFPAWSIAVFRTWLADGRTPRDLLADVAAERWLTWDSAELMREERRADGARVTSIRRPPRAPGQESPISAWVVEQSAAQTAILFVYAGRPDADAANEIAARISAEVNMAPLDNVPPLADAEAAGVKLAGDLQKAGPAPRWGREKIETTYRCTTRDETVVVQRAARARDPAQGYEGSMWRRIGRAREDREVWTVDGRAGAYMRRIDLLFDQSAVQVDEQRGRAGDAVTRRILIDGREREHWSFTPGPAFVPPPTEPIIQGWVARDEPGAAIVAVSSLLGSGTHTELLRHLSADGPYPRVLVQRDYSPEGAIEAFDDARAETQYEIYPTVEFRRAK